MFLNFLCRTASQFQPRIGMKLPCTCICTLCCMNVSGKIALIIICGFVVMHAGQLGGNSSIKSGWHRPAIQVGGASASKLEHRTALHHLRRREATRETSAMVTNELAARQVSPPGNCSSKFQCDYIQNHSLSFRMLTTRLWKTTLVVLLWSACRDCLAKQAMSSWPSLKATTLQGRSRTGMPATARFQF